MSFNVKTFFFFFFLFQKRTDPKGVRNIKYRNISSFSEPCRPEYHGFVSIYRHFSNLNLVQNVSREIIIVKAKGKCVVEIQQV
jgi:hypothetical protein